jgi:hypothetical protein
MEKCFVYEWINTVTSKKYIGYHKGSENDGYISSSKNPEFWNDYDLGLLERHILFHGSMEECVTLESKLLQDTDIEKLYNRNRNGKVIFTDDVKEKMRDAARGRKQTPEHIRNRSAALKGRVGGFAGKNHSQATKDKMKSVERTTEWKQAISKALKNKPGSFLGKTHKKKQCPHCGKMVAVPGFVRWHGDACKLNQGASNEQGSGRPG